MKRFVIIFVLLAIALGGVLFTQIRKQRQALDAPSGGSGVIEGTRVAVMARLGNRILDITVREGETVTAGQVLVTLDCTEPEAARAGARAAVAASAASAAAAEAAVSAAEAAATAAKAGVRGAKAAEDAASAGARGVRARALVASRTAKRVAKLHKGGKISERKLDEARSAADSLAAERRVRTAQVAGARAKREVAEAQAGAAGQQSKVATARHQAVIQEGARTQAALARTEALVVECTLKAPRAGVVQTRAAEPGELARPGMPILLIVDAREVTATVYLPNAELAVARPGRKVEVRADAWPDRVWEGEIVRVGAEAAFTPRNVQTRTDRDRLVYPIDVRLANADRALRPGMPVEVIIVPMDGDP